MTAGEPARELSPQPLLGELEAAVMQIIWQRGEVTVRDVLDALLPERPLKYTTVMTVMSRLAQKGVLVARKQGKTFYYHPTLTMDELIAHRAQRAVQTVLANYGDAAMAYFLRELAGVDSERLATLRELAGKQEQSDAP